MPSSCCVVGCESRSGQGTSLFRIPWGRTQRRSWVRSISRLHWVAKVHHRVCAKHFVSGHPSPDPDNIDYRPTLHMKGKPSDLLACNEQVKQRQQRSKRRHEMKHVHKVAQLFEEAGEVREVLQDRRKQQSLLFHSYVTTSLSQPAACQETENDMSQTTTCQGTQTDLSMSDIDKLEEAAVQAKWGVHKLKDNDKLTKFYTGLPTFAVLLWLFRFLQPKANCMTYWSTRNSKRKTSRPVRRRCMSLMDEFVFVLVRLKTGIFLQDLADRFQVSVAHLSTVFNTWIVLLEKELQRLNPCPSREIIQKTLPPCFANFSNIRFIIDCTELFIQKASSLTAQNLTFSNYKHHNTVKFLVAITPTGAICFVSTAWGGRTSDRQITEKSGFLDFVQNGDLVLADKGFTIGDLLAKRQAFLNIPPFLTNQQFTPEQIKLTKDIAKVRIHVERAIGRVKQFHILDPVMPLTLKHNITAIFRVCCFLTNLSKPLVDYR